MKLIKLQDMTFRADAYIAHGTMTIPSTLHTPEYQAIALYLRGINEPIVLTYADVDTREVDIALLEQLPTEV